MRVAVVWPPLCDPVAPDHMWVDAVRRVAALGPDVTADDMNARFLDHMLEPRTLAPLLEPLAERFGTLERKKHLAPDEHHRHAALAPLVPLIGEVLSRLDGARTALSRAESYRRSRGGGAPFPAVGHRAVVDIARAALAEALALEAWLSGPAGLTLDTGALDPFLEPVREACEWRDADAVIAIVRWDVQLPFARALCGRLLAQRRRAAVALAAGERGISLDVPLLSVSELSNPGALARVVGSPVPTPPPRKGRVELLSARRPFAALTPWPDRREAMPAGRVAGPRAERALACATACPVETPVPLAADVAPARVLDADRAQAAAIDAGERPEPAPEPEPGAPARGRGVVITRCAHGTSRGGARLGVGRTAREQIRGGLRRSPPPARVVDLERGTVHELDRLTLAVLEAADGRRTAGQIVSAISGGARDETLARRVDAALAALARSGLLEPG